MSDDETRWVIEHYKQLPPPRMTRDTKPLDPVYTPSGPGGSTPFDEVVMAVVGIGAMLLGFILLAFIAELLFLWLR